MSRDLIAEYKPLLKKFMDVGLKENPFSLNVVKPTLISNVIEKLFGHKKAKCFYKTINHGYYTLDKEDSVYRLFWTNGKNIHNQFTAPKKPAFIFKFDQELNLTYVGRSSGIPSFIKWHFWFKVMPNTNTKEITTGIEHLKSMVNVLDGEVDHQLRIN